jgi:tRNA threonylcarbamoyl adenosine modification protein YeaZ
MTPTYTLAIESATNKGSVSLLKGEDEIAFWIGGERETLSSALLPQISRLLSENNITASDLQLIAACRGPGSFTGVRVGLSVAKGFQSALGITALGIPLTEILALSFAQKAIAAVIPAGRDEVYVQTFSPGSKASSDISVTQADNIPDIEYIVTTQDLKDEQRHTIEALTTGKVSIASDNLARFVGLLAVRAHEEGKGESYPLSPLYVKEFGR